MKYNTIFTCIHCLLPLRLNVFYKIGEFCLLNVMVQCICIKFYIRKKCNKVRKMLTKAYDESAMSKPEFKSGTYSISEMVVKMKKAPGPTLATDGNVGEVIEMLMNDRRIRIREVTNDVDISLAVNNLNKRLDQSSF